MTIVGDGEDDGEHDDADNCDDGACAGYDDVDVDDGDKGDGEAGGGPITPHRLLQLDARGALGHGHWPSKVANDVILAFCHSSGRLGSVASRSIFFHVGVQLPQLCCGCVEGFQWFHLPPFIGMTFLVDIHHHVEAILQVLFTQFCLQAVGSEQDECMRNKFTFKEN